MKDIVDFKTREKDEKRDLIKDDPLLKKLKLDGELHQNTFITMYKTRSATIHYLHLLKLGIYKIQDSLNERLNIESEFYILENLLKMIEDLEKESWFCSKFSCSPYTSI